MTERGAMIHFAQMFRPFAPIAATWLAVCAFLPDVARAQAETGVVRVAPTGVDDAECGSGTSPCRSLQFAVDRFSLPGSGTVLVAGGTYTSTGSDRIVRVTRRQITMRGGYAPDFTIADPDTWPVVVDGENARKGFLVDCPMASPDPCSLTLEDLTITRCRASLDPGTRNAFGGALDAFLATITLTDVSVIGNVARGLDGLSGLPGDGGGGGLSFRSSTAILTRVRIDQNTARGGDGSGSAARGGLGVGGGIFSYESTVSMSEVTADGNLAVAGNAPTSIGFAGIQRADGLGGFWALIYGNTSVDGLRATLNRAEGGDGGIGGLGLGGAIFFQIVTQATLADVALSENVAVGGVGTTNLGGGGAIFAEDIDLEIRGGNLVRNQAIGAEASGVGGTGGGGGIYMNSVLAQDTRLDATNVIIGANEAVGGSGAPPGYAFGGGIFLQCPQSSCSAAVATSNTAQLTHVTLADNVVASGEYNQGAALYVSRFSAATSSFGMLTGHATPPLQGFYAGEAVLALGPTILDHTLLDGNPVLSTTALEGSFTNLDPTTGDPGYADPTAIDPDYHILATSAAREAAIGTATTIDIDGETRPDPDGGADLGADEFVAPEPTGVAGTAVSTLVALRWRRALSRARDRLRSESSKPRTSSADPG